MLGCGAGASAGCIVAVGVIAVLLKKANSTTTATGKEPVEFLRSITQKRE